MMENIGLSDPSPDPGPWSILGSPTRAICEEHAKNQWLEVLFDPHRQDPERLLALLAEGRRSGLAARHLAEPVFSALWNEQQWAALALLGSGEALEQRDSEQRSVLSVACAVALPAVVSHLIAHGVQVNPSGEGADRPLHEVCAQGDLLLAQMLLDAGASVHAEGARGNIPLHHACWSKNPKLCLMLVLRGADSQALNNGADTPLDFLNSTGCGLLTLRPVRKAMQTGHSIRAARLAIDALLGEAAAATVASPPGP